jgi:hypothetical protein
VSTRPSLHLHIFPPSSLSIPFLHFTPSQGTFISPLLLPTTTLLFTNYIARQELDTSNSPQPPQLTFRNHILRWKQSTATSPLLLSNHYTPFQESHCPSGPRYNNSSPKHWQFAFHHFRIASSLISFFRLPWQIIALYPLPADHQSSNRIIYSSKDD